MLAPYHPHLAFALLYFCQRSTSMDTRQTQPNPASAKEKAEGSRENANTGKNKNTEQTLRHPGREQGGADANR
jgi:hypothetical protein